MPILPKYYVNQRDQVLRDVRPARARLGEFFSKTDTLIGIGAFTIIGLIAEPMFAWGADFYLLFFLWYAKWVLKRDLVLPFKLPQNAGMKDAHNPPPGKGGSGPAEGILYVGNLDEAKHPDNGRELWLTNSDARTHILFLGTTGSGKTEGLKSLVTNAMTWGSGFVYVDGKADTDLWASLFSLARRFGRDDDLLVLNYMTANSDDGATSNTMNPFSNGSASYLTNMVVNLMPDAGGDNAMWKERAVALLGALMPALTWKRDKEGLLLDVGVLRDFIELPAIIKLSRDPNLPERIIRALKGYLNTLPGYIDAAFDDEGNERPPAPDQPMYDLQVARQQHGYLSMQFTRSLQSLADEYGYIFKTELADIDVLDVVLNRRILVALIPALEKSSDEAANLGKIIAACLKGMMGSTLGNTVEGSWENAINSKQTRSASSFMTVFDEVGYYTAQGMAVMAAQARSLGFSLIFAAQDLPSMEKRVKQEAQSILGNCNLKIFGKLEDPTDTKKFFQDHVGSAWVMENKGMVARTNSVSSLFFDQPYEDERGATAATTRVRADYDHLRGQREGEVHMLFAEFIVRARMFHAVPDKVKALRVHKMLPVPGTTPITAARERMISEIAARFKTPDWTAAEAISAAPGSTSAEIAAMAQSSQAARQAGHNPTETGLLALASLSKVAGKGRGAAAARAPASAKTGGETSAAPATASYASSVDIGGVAQGLPLNPGDEYAVTELEAGAPAMAEGVAQTAYAASTEEAPAMLVSSGYIPAEIDMGVVPSLFEDDGTDVDITQIQLPGDLAAIVEQAAEELNRVNGA
jgi:intracellular multiplication protein IcmO